VLQTLILAYHPSFKLEGRLIGDGPELGACKQFVN
jgi:hypothetical protein